MAEDRRLPELFKTGTAVTKKAIGDLSSAIKKTDVKSFAALKDLTKVVVEKQKTTDNVQKSLKSTDKKVTSLEKALAKNATALQEIAKAQKSMAADMSKFAINVASGLGTVTASIDKLQGEIGKISSEVDRVEKTVKSVAKAAPTSPSYDSKAGADLTVLPFGTMKRDYGRKGLGGKAAPRSSITKSMSRVSIPTMIRGLGLSIGTALAGFGTDLASQLAFSTGHEKVGGALAVGSNAITGSAIGGVLGAIGGGLAGSLMGGVGAIPGAVAGWNYGRAAGAAVGAGYGLYTQGGNIFGNNISPEVKKMQEDNERRQEVRDRDKANQQQAIQQNPDLKFSAPGQTPVITTTPTTAGIPSGVSYNIPKVSKNLAENQREAYSAAMAEGLSDKAAKILVANMSGESLANPSNRHWDRKHYSQGIVQWDDVRSAEIKRQFGKFPIEMTVKEQVKAAIWEMSTKPAYREAWNALKNEQMSDRDRLYTVVKNYERPQYPEADTVKRMGFLQGLNFGKNEKVDSNTDTASSISPKGGSPSVTPSNTPMGTSPSTLPAIAAATGSPTSTAAPTMSTKTDSAPSMLPKSAPTGGGGMPSNDIVALGKALQGRGINVSEHPAFGGVTHVHAKNSAHYRAAALDINGPPGMKEAYDPVWGPKFDKLASDLRSAGYKVIWRAPGHFNHLHVQTSSSPVSPDSTSTNESGASGQYPSAGGGGAPSQSGGSPVSTPPAVSGDSLNPLQEALLKQMKENYVGGGATMGPGLAMPSIGSMGGGMPLPGGVMGGGIGGVVGTLLTGLMQPTIQAPDLELRQPVAHGHSGDQPPIIVNVAQQQGQNPGAAPMNVTPPTSPQWLNTMKNYMGASYPGHNHNYYGLGSK